MIGNCTLLSEETPERTCLLHTVSESNSFKAKVLTIFCPCSLRSQYSLLICFFLSYLFPPFPPSFSWARSATQQPTQFIFPTPHSVPTMHASRRVTSRRQPLQIGDIAHGLGFSKFTKTKKTKRPRLFGRKGNKGTKSLIGSIRRIPDQTRGRPIRRR